MVTYFSALTVGNKTLTTTTTNYFKADCFKGRHSKSYMNGSKGKRNHLYLRKTRKQYILSPRLCDKTSDSRSVSLTVEHFQIKKKVLIINDQLIS